MEEKKSVIQIYTIVFFLVVVGFVGFLIYQGYKDTDNPRKYTPREKVRKIRSSSLLQFSEENFKA